MVYDFKKFDRINIINGVWVKILTGNKDNRQAPVSSDYFFPL